LGTIFLIALAFLSLVDISDSAETSLRGSACSCLGFWSLLSDYPQDEWTAAFHCALVFIDLQGREYLFEGECRGIIIT